MTITTSENCEIIIENKKKEKVNNKKQSRNLLAPVSGFPELPIEHQIVFDKVRQKICEEFQLHGFAPLETATVEKLELLALKNGAGFNGKEIYTLGRADAISEQNMRQKLALKFDLTMPLARFIAYNKNTLNYPFLRYQIQPVYRGEHAIESRGRHRQFYQFDIDAIGRDELSFDHDAQMIAVIYKIFTKILNLDDFIVRINNRKLLQSLLGAMGVQTINIKKAISIIDDLEKQEESETESQLSTIGMSSLHASLLLKLFKNIAAANPLDALEVLKATTMYQSNDLFKEGVDELAHVINTIAQLKVPLQYYCIDLSIARGLDYYTSTVYETKVLSLPHLGSVCSGGRYDDLVGSLTGNSRDRFPGVGISIGMSRLFPELIAKGKLKVRGCCPAKVMVARIDEELRSNDIELSASLRDQFGIQTLLYSGNQVKLGDQIKYANNIGVYFIIFQGKTEMETSSYCLKNLITKQQKTYSNLAVIAEEINNYYNSLDNLDDSISERSVDFTEDSQRDILCNLKSNIQELELSL